MKLSIVSFLGALVLCSFNPTCEDFTISNSALHSPGIVTIQGAAGNSQVLIGSTGSYTTTICYQPLGVAINSSFITYPNSGVVTLSTGSKVAVSWTNSNAIEIIDYLEQNVTCR